MHNFDSLLDLLDFLIPTTGVNMEKDAKQKSRLNIWV